MPAIEPWSAPRAAEIIAGLADREGAMLPILHALQEAFGFVHEEAVPLIAEALNVSKAEVHGCITFYHDFRAGPPGRQVVKLCRAEACQAVGAEAMHAEVLRRLGIEWHGTTRDGAVTVEPVYCLGLRACGPAALIDDAPVARLDADGLQAALIEVAA
ncbi:formate dehydrogenase subunit gamma [Methylobacterium isbiliense]|uniref:NADP-reducing hydrogenase subunit HndA n=1 Tax=Methylobacterium isbiliense TaxID=315478 RepID=A0ABQ4SCR0_9HYPH|nr:formate dehydrogenase subunit gamma [Methylobacterium isbiliense]MDN3622021.1 formate dehydrogenase subunit gamma [Methylobacterium isbiliense]GJD99465.1 NADP-reducing hydrogenase subunit HndA [Methylobacterium isbiliense]